MIAALVFTGRKPVYRYQLLDAKSVQRRIAPRVCVEVYLSTRCNHAKPSIDRRIARSGEAAPRVACNKLHEPTQTRRTIRSRFALAIAALAAFVGACAKDHFPENATQKLYGPEKSGVGADPFHGRGRKQRSIEENYCPPPGTSNFLEGKAAARPSGVGNLTMRYSPGDRFNIQLPGSPEFNGDYVVNADGRVILPFAGELPAVGLTNTELTVAVERALIKAQLFLPGQFRVSVRPVLYAPINVSISGAVYLPGRVNIGAVRDADKGEKALAKFGDNPTDRFLASAFKAGGGVRPDADLSNIKLIRNGKVTRLNWNGAITGGAVDDLALIEGDQIEIGESRCFQSALMRPSQITPQSIRVFISNLTAPAFSNAASDSAKNVASLPYGTRLLAGAVAANCVGGSLASNAHRYVVLISRNPKTHQTEVIQRRVEELVTSPDRDTINPFLLPDDSLACYDSAVTDMREVGTTIGIMLSPAGTLRNAIGK